MTLQTSGQISVSQINTEVAGVNSNSLATLAANSHEYRAQFDNLQNAPHSMSEWYGYDDTILWEHTITVGHKTYAPSKTTYNRYGFDSVDFDFVFGSSMNMGACSESNPRWAAAAGRQNVHVGWFLWDSQDSSLQFYLWRALGSTAMTNTGFSTVQISTGSAGVGPLNRTDASYTLRTAAPAYDAWIWTHANVGGLNSSPFGTQIGETSTVRWE